MNVCIVFLGGFNAFSNICQSNVNVLLRYQLVSCTTLFTFTLKPVKGIRMYYIMELLLIGCCGRLGVIV